MFVSGGGGFLWERVGFLFVIVVVVCFWCIFVSLMLMFNEIMHLRMYNLVPKPGVINILLLFIVKTMHVNRF